MKLKYLLAALSVLVVVMGLSLGSSGAFSAKPILTVYKTPTCGCCSKWIDHVEKSGFEVEVRDVQRLDLTKAAYQVPGNLRSCHTAIVDGYVIEGHVPAEDVKRLLASRPNVAGIAVAGMPIGSPGMEGGTPQPYDVIVFHKSGEQEIFARHL